jgi:hypothetical protein
VAAHGGARLAEAVRRDPRGRGGVLEGGREQREVRPAQEARPRRVGSQAGEGAQVVDGRRHQGDEVLLLALLREPDADRGHADDLGHERAGELRGLADDDVGRPRPAGGQDPGEGRARVDAREDVADDALGDQAVDVLAADLVEDRGALLGRRIVDGPQRQALGPHHRSGLAGGCDEDVGARALEGSGEGDQRAEVTGPGLGREENAHGGI